MSTTAGLARIFRISYPLTPLYTISCTLNESNLFSALSGVARGLIEMC